jgi:hypothetical protein
MSRQGLPEKGLRTLLTRNFRGVNELASKRAAKTRDNDQRYDKRLLQADESVDFDFC